MRKVQFLGRECIYFKGISNDFKGKLDIYSMSEQNLEFARRKENGDFVVLKEEDIAKEYLDLGRGIYYKGYFIFKYDSIKNNIHFEKFKQWYLEVEGEAKSYLKGILYKGLKDISLFYMVKSFISLFEMGVFTVQQLDNKLNTYLKPEYIDVLKNELMKSNEMAG
jgi:hypothetical protein